MVTDLISKKTRYEFQETFSSFYVLREIEAEFDNADVGCDLDHQPVAGGQRRGLVAQYYHTIDFTKSADVRKLCSVYESVLHRLQGMAEAKNEEAERRLRILIRCLERDGFTYDGVRLVPRVGNPLPEIDEVVTHLDLPELQRQIQRIRTAVDDDPALAIGTAKELIETTCKTILGDRGVAVDPGWDLPQLVKRTRQELLLLPDDIPDVVRGADTIRRLLGALGNIGSGLGEVRNLYGTGHGKHGRASSIPPRIARLAVGCAATLTTFLLETHRDRG